MDSGWLQKQGNSIRKGWRPRWFWVDHEQHCLKYAEKQGEKPLGSIPFATVQARVNNTSSKPFAIDFVTPNRTYYVAAKSQEEQLAWIDLFRRATKAAIDGVPLSPISSSAGDSSAVSFESSSSPTPSFSVPTGSSDPDCASPSRLHSSASGSDLSSLTETKLTDVLESQVAHRPVLARVMSAWNVVKTNVERGVVFLQDPLTLQYSRKVAEVRGDNLFLYSSEAKAAQRRNSSTSIVLTMCQVRPGRLPEAEDASAPGETDDAIFRVFSLVTPLTTFYFMGQTVAETSRWIKVFQHLQKVSRERARADSIMASQTRDTPASPRPNFVVSSPRTLTPAVSPTPQRPTSSESTSSTGSGTSPAARPTSAPDAESPTAASTVDPVSPRTTVDGAMPVRPSPPTTALPPGGASPRATHPPSVSVSPQLGVEGDILTREIPTIGLEILDANTRRILEIGALPENRRCADCRDEDPQWASINLGIFICLECSGIHRSLGVHISKVRSVDLDRWDEAMIDGMAAVGNEKSNAIYEAELKPENAPTPHSSRGDKDSFIKAKYVHKSFCVGGGGKDTLSPRFTSGRASATLASLVYQEGHLNTSSESDKGWRTRWVVLKQNKLLFYKARADPDPRNSVTLSHAHVKSTTLDRINTFELVVPGDVIYLQAENSSDFFLWMDLIKTSQKLFKSSQSASFSVSSASDPNSPASDSASSSPAPGDSGSAPASPEEVFRTGWLYKRGDKVKSWKKRYFVLRDNKLTYYAAKADKQPKGSIALSLAVPKEGVHEAGTTIKGLGDASYSYTFEIVVTGRVYYIAATSELETREWINTIRASKKAHESRVAMSIAATKNKELAISAPEQALEAISVDNRSSLQSEI